MGRIVVSDMQRRTAELARATAYSAGWIGDRAKVVLNRSWLADSDQAPRMLLVQATENVPKCQATGAMADLAAQARAAKSTFQAIEPSELAAARADLKSRIDWLEWLLSGEGTDAKAAADGWKDALQWDELKKVAASDNADPEKLQSLAENVRAKQGSETLDRNPKEKENTQTNLDFRTALSGLHAALRNYRLLTIAAGPGGSRRFNNTLGELANSLSADPATWTTKENANPASFLGELQAMHQAKQLVEAVRGHFDQPNLAIRAPQEFIAKLSGGAINIEPDDHYTDCILGTNIVGKTRPRGDQAKTVTLVPNDQHAVLAVRFTGTVDSYTTGYHPPVTITSHGSTSLLGTTQVLITGDGFTVAPWCSQACTRTCIDCIAVCGGRLVQRIAPRKVYESKPEAECIAGQHAQQKLSVQLESSSTEALGRSNRNYKLRIRDPLASWGAFPQIHYSTTATELMIRASEANDFQLAAPSESPPVTGNPFLAMRVHESFVNNLLATSLAGREVSQFQFENGFGNLLGRGALEKAKEEAGTDEEKAKRKITFADENPVTVHFADQGFTITIRGTKFTGEKGAIEEAESGPENITAHYKIEGPNGASQATRGDIDVTPPASRAITPLRSQKIRREKQTLTERFNKFLPKTIKFEGLDFGEAEDDFWTKIGKLQAEQVHAGDGWLSIDWRQADAPPDGAATP
jgi:hypothetical protein